MLDGIINVYKEAGFTSHDVVAKLRGICGQRRVGHTGTLDPDAVGVLPVCLGSGTRVCDMLTDRSKEYVARLRLGIVTETQDLSGAVLEEKPVLCTEAEAREAALRFRGEYLQVPPMYSALKVGGKKLYELARAGKEVERQPRPVIIYELEILDCSLPEMKLRVVCSKGTYIRTLCHDIGARLGCGGAMASLERTRVGEFSIEDAFTLARLQELKDGNRLEEAVLPVDSVFSDLPALYVREEFRKLAENGNALDREQTAEQNESGPKPERTVDQNESGPKPEQTVEQNESGPKPERTADQSGSAVERRVRIYGMNGRFYGIYVWDSARGLYRPVKMFPSGER